MTTSAIEYKPAAIDSTKDSEEAQNKHHYDFIKGAKAIALTGPLNILLLCAPLALLSQSLEWYESITFILSVLALAPCAERLGFVTEQLVIHTNETTGGLLNASFGNATELIVAISALSKGLFRLVQLSLLGSVLSNMLLVLGMSFLFGGLKFKIQRFSVISAQVNMSMLMLSVMGLLLPTILVWANSGSARKKEGPILGFSRGTSIILFALYLAYLHFQLNTHSSIYEGGDSGVTDEQSNNNNNNGTASSTSTIPSKAPSAASSPSPSPSPSTFIIAEEDSDSDHSEGETKEDIEGGGATSGSGSGSGVVRSPIIHPFEIEGTFTSALTRSRVESSVSDDLDHSTAGSMHGDVEKGLLKTGTSAARRSDVEAGDDGQEDEEEEEEEDILGFRYSMFWLCIITVLISFLSDALVETIQLAAIQCKIPGVFLSTIIIPIVGNAAEHAGSVMFARKNKLDLSLGVAIGSSTQVALMVIPLLVLLGWCMNKDMSLDFSAFEGTTLFLSVVIVAFAINHGQSNWLVGALLIGAYLIISMGFWVHDDEKL